MADATDQPTINNARPREDDAETAGLERSSKRARTDGNDADVVMADAVETITVDETKTEVVEEKKPRYVLEDLLPPSRSLLASDNPQERLKDEAYYTFESDVGITEYVGKDVPPFQGIIKQRYVIFSSLVFAFDYSGVI